MTQPSFPLQIIRLEPGEKCIDEIPMAELIGESSREGKIERNTDDQAHIVWKERQADRERTDHQNGHELIPKAVSEKHSRL
jgi:hypothetical protein